MPEKSSPTSSRRDFLRLAGLGSAAGAAAAMTSGAEAAGVEEEARAAPAEYRETDHVKTFYRLARF